MLDTEKSLEKVLKTYYHTVQIIQFNKKKK